MKESIQEFLLSQGFTVNESQYTFSMWRSGYLRIEIPFSALAGHTVESFQRIALDKGWITPEAPAETASQIALTHYGIFLFGLGEMVG